ncbi:ferredoxin--NADP reductase [Sandaracinobacter neustonicus]|uniref:ferredoxin--NADP(+) reductase n=1 Tax=Sandaracinobacter neustonicus TaxID=1715348 RepID=A0A501XNP3_9SPHN|nr:ferredoxin--NADP reductase [Sandaracinobacter neustonicus]TPE61924.1 ferredoxin--NADP reductase [Sandaracinobacter neustonicus]
MSDRAATSLAPSAVWTLEEVRSVRHWNEHLFSFSISRPAALRFRSGEFVMLGLEVEGRPLLRAYSIASPSYADELEFLSIKVADGKLTSRLQLIQPGDQIVLGRKPTGTLVADALLPGKRLFMLSTGTGLAPFLSLARDPDIYQAYDQILLVHCVRTVSDLAFRDELESHFADDPLVRDEALLQFRYLPTVTREPFHTSGRIGALIDNGRLFRDLTDSSTQFDPENDRIMMCGSMSMIKELKERFEGLGFIEGSRNVPGTYVIERAFAE